MSLEDLLNIKVSVASKTEQSIGDAPSSVTVITREEMLNMGLTCVEDVLNYIPGFVVNREISSDIKKYISVRGGRFYDVLFLYNGQRISSEYQGGYSNGTQYIPVENIKQIEVIRGPGSALYGSNAFLGVVNIVTVDDVNDVYVAAGDLERKEASINISKEIDDLKIAAFVKGFSDIGEKYSDLMDSWGIESDTRDPIKGFNASMTLKFKDFTLDMRHNETENADFIMWESLGNGINSVKQAQSHINLKYTHAFNDRLDMDASTGYMYDRWDAVFTQIPLGMVPIAWDEDTQSPMLNYATLAGGPYLTMAAGNVNLDFRFEVMDTNHLIFGVSSLYAKIIECSNQGYWNYGGGPDHEYFGTLNPDVDGMEFNYEEHRTVIGVYIQDQQQIGESLTLTAGLRYDDYSDFGSSVNPRAAAVYSTPFQSKIKLMYGEAFRAPNFSELYDRNNPTYEGDPDLDAEKVKTFEVAYLQNFSFMQAGLTFFHSEVSDMIDLVDVEGAPLQTYDNLSDAKTKGLEFELKCSPVKELLLGVTYLHFLDPDKDVLFVPANSGSVNINYHTGPINWNINGLYRESHKLVPTQDDYWVFNTALYVKLADNLRLKGVIYNLADEEYYTFDRLLTRKGTEAATGAPIGFDEEGIINRGRTFTIGIECQL